LTLRLGRRSTIAPWRPAFDVAGHPTGGGNTDWARQNPIPVRHAWAVQTLLDTGATLIGKTITDEVSLGILRENPFEGTPSTPLRRATCPAGSLPLRRRPRV
jgi:amidase